LKHKVEIHMKSWTIWKEIGRTYAGNLLYYGHMVYSDREC